MTRTLATHAIDDRLLMGYAAGLLPEAYDLIVATVVSMDDDARARLEGFEAMGGALLAEQTVAPLREGSFEEVLARINAVPPEGTVHPDVVVPRSDPVFPQPLREAVGGDLDAVRWKPSGRGVRHCILPTWDGEAAVRLMSVPPGLETLGGGLGGCELTLCLQGAYEDATGRYERGDLQVSGPAPHHAPRADARTGCICLAVTDAPSKLSGLLPKIAQRFLNA